MYIILFTLIGLCFGSFINVLIYRLPKKKSIIIPRSFCPKCKDPIPLYRNIPILSFIIQKGQCHNCKQAISIEYPLVEVITAFIWFLFSYLTFSHEVDLAVLFDFFFSIITISFFIPLAIIDLKYLYFPYRLLIPVIIISLLYSIINFWLFDNLNSILGILTALIFLSIIYTTTRIWLYFKNRNEEPMGFGDILLIIPIAVWLGPLGVLLCIFMSSFIALCFWFLFNHFKIIKLDDRMPFGPYLIVSAIIIKIGFILKLVPVSISQII